MFLLTGDYVSHEDKYIAPVADVLGKLSSEFGTFACLGNHDHWTNADLVTHLFRGEGINLLINEGLRMEIRGASFWLAGVDDYMVGKTDVGAAMKGAFPDELKILLAHNPIIFRQSVRAKIDLTLSGHTHGGQVKIRDDEKRILPRRKLTAGLHRRKESQIYITRGIGTVVLPVRYQCPPEISLLELRAQ
jgi:predicted MPP superfamily phosphohydrolase